MGGFCVFRPYWQLTSGRIPQITGRHKSGLGTTIFENAHGASTIRNIVLLLLFVFLIDLAVEKGGEK